MLSLLWLKLNEAGKAIIDTVGAWNLLLPVAHIYPYNLPRHTEKERDVGAVISYPRAITKSSVLLLLQHQE